MQTPKKYIYMYAFELKKKTQKTQFTNTLKIPYIMNDIIVELLRIIKFKFLHE